MNDPSFRLSALVSEKFAYLSISFYNGSTLLTAQADSLRKNKKLKYANRGNDHASKVE